MERGGEKEKLVMKEEEEEVVLLLEEALALALAWRKSKSTDDEGETRYTV